MQISRIFGAETTILRAFQTFLRTVISLEKLRAPKDLIPDTIRFLISKTFFSSSLVTQIVTQSNKFTELRNGVWQIDSICQTQLVRQLARPLTTSYDVKFYESILFVKLYQWSAQPSSIETWRQLLMLLHNQINLLDYDTKFYKSIPFVKLSQ